jgi:hypothetical protein
MQDHDEWLARACPSRSFPRPEINVSKAIAGEVAETDAEEFDVTRRVTSSLNQNPPMGWSHSLVVLTASRFTLYCEQDRLTLAGLEMSDDLSCRTAGLQYSFGYSGPPEHERDAEEIFTSLQ